MGLPAQGVALRSAARNCSGSRETRSTYQGCSRGGCPEWEGPRWGGLRLSSTQSHPVPVTFSPTNSRILARSPALPSKLSQQGFGPRLLDGAVASFTKGEAQLWGCRWQIGRCWEQGKGRKEVHRD